MEFIYQHPVIFEYNFAQIVWIVFQNVYLVRAAHMTQSAKWKIRIRPIICHFCAAERTLTACNEMKAREMRLTAMVDRFQF